jgi:Leucine-rich repeat (LRR) protein
MISKTLLSFLLIFALVPFTGRSQVVNVQDSLALVDFYNNTNGPNWTDHTNWLTQKQVNTWHGVTLNNGRVTRIILVDNNLYGNIPTTIGNLTGLSYLALVYNNLNGPIPLSIGNLTGLTSIDLHNNQLSGDIPASLGNLVNLTELYLQFNHLTGIPSSISNLANLTRLEIYNNEIGGNIPVALSSLTKLRFLVLEANRFTGSIPPSLGNLQALTVLDLSYNQLTDTIPAALGNLSSLVYLYLQGNSLNGSIPSSLGNIPQLNSLTLADNNLSGPIPLALIQLNQFTLQNNNFTFTEIEPIAYRNFAYAPQHNIKLSRINDRLAVSAGGTLSNNTYTWYKAGGAMVATIKADSTFKPASTGSYYAEVANDVAVYLTLHSDTVKANAVTIKMCPPVASTNIAADITGTSYQWQADSTGTGQYINITDNSYYTGTDTSVLQLINIPSGWDNYRYRCVVDGLNNTMFIIQFQNVWTGSIDQDWANPDNWSCNTVPDSNTNVTILGGIIFLNSSTTIKSLTIKNNASLTISSSAHLTIRF